MKCEKIRFILGSDALTAFNLLLACNKYLVLFAVQRRFQNVVEVIDLNDSTSD